MSVTQARELSHLVKCWILFSDPIVLTSALLPKIISKEEHTQALELDKSDLMSGSADVALSNISPSFSFSTLKIVRLEPLYFSVVRRTRNKSQGVIVLPVKAKNTGYLGLHSAPRPAHRGTNQG